MSKAIVPITTISMYYRRMEKRTGDVVRRAMPTGTYRDVAVYVSTVRVHVPVAVSTRVFEAMKRLFPRTLYPRPIVRNSPLYTSGTYTTTIPGVEMRYVLPQPEHLKHRVDLLFERARTVRAERAIAVALVSSASMAERGP